MIPLRSTERVRSTATVTLILILLNTVIFLYERFLPSWALDSFIAPCCAGAFSNHVLVMLTPPRIHTPTPEASA